MGDEFSRGYGDGSKNKLEEYKRLVKEFQRINNPALGYEWPTAHSNTEEDLLKTWKEKKRIRLSNASSVTRWCMRFLDSAADMVLTILNNTNTWIRRQIFGILPSPRFSITSLEEFPVETWGRVAQWIQDNPVIKRSPPCSTIDIQQYFPQALRDCDHWLDQLRKGKYLPEAQAKELCRMATEIISKQLIMRNIQTSVTLCGDIQGSFEDLIQALNLGETTHFVFMGNYVDRGRNSVDVIVLAMMVDNPDYITLLRGNYETKELNKSYGFYDECSIKYSNVNVWKYVTDIFEILSLAALMNSTVVVVHGGLSPTIGGIDQLSELESDTRFFRDSPICDLLYSDPDIKDRGWNNHPSGIGHLFGEDITSLFLFSNNLSFMRRSEQLIHKGYASYHSDLLVSHFSTSKYCKRCRNHGAVMQLSESHERKFKIFSIQFQNDPSLGPPNEESILVKQLAARKGVYIPDDSSTLTPVDNTISTYTPVDDTISTLTPVDAHPRTVRFSSVVEYIEAELPMTDSSEDDFSEDDLSEDDFSEDDLSEDDSSEDDSSENDLSEDDSSENDLSEDDSSENDLSEDDSSENDLSEDDSSENDSSE